MRQIDAVKVRGCGFGFRHPQRRAGLAEAGGEVDEAAKDDRRLEANRLHALPPPFDATRDGWMGPGDQPPMTMLDQNPIVGHQPGEMAALGGSLHDGQGEARLSGARNAPHQNAAFPHDHGGGMNGGRGCGIGHPDLPIVRQKARTAARR